MTLNVNYKYINEGKTFWITEKEENAINLLKMKEIIKDINFHDHKNQLNQTEGFL